MCNLHCQLNEKVSRNLIFEAMINSKIFEMLDLSNVVWSQFDVRNTSTEKQVGLNELNQLKLCLSENAKIIQ